MALISDFLKVSDALKKNREGVFDLMDARFDRFQIQNDGLRDMYLNNQRISEELSQTRLNDFNNKFDLENRQNNRDTLLETSRLNAQFGLKDSRFNNDNQLLTQRRDRLSTEADIAGSENKILKFEVERELNDLAKRFPMSPDADVVEYYKNLQRQATLPGSKKAIRDQAIKQFEPEVEFMNDFEKAVDNVLGASDTTREAKERQFESFLNRSIQNGTFETLDRIKDAGFLTPRQRKQYDTIIDFLTKVNEDGSQSYTLEQLLGEPDAVIAPTTPATTAAPSAVAPVVAPEVAPVTQPEALPLPDAVTPVPEQTVPSVPTGPQPVNPVTATPEPDLTDMGKIPDAPDAKYEAALLEELNEINAETLPSGELEEAANELVNFSQDPNFGKLLPSTQARIDSELNQISERIMSGSESQSQAKTAKESERTRLKEGIELSLNTIKELEVDHLINGEPNSDIMDNTVIADKINSLMSAIKFAEDRLNKLDGVEPEAKLNSDPTNNPHPDLFESEVIETQPESSIDIETRELKDFINARTSEIQQLIDEHKVSDQRDIDLMSIPAFANEINLLLKDIEDAEEMLTQLSGKPEAKLNSDPTNNPHPDLFESEVIETQPESTLTVTKPEASNEEKIKRIKRMKEFLVLEESRLREILDKHEASDQRNMSMFSIPSIANKINSIMDSIEFTKKEIEELSNSVSER